MPNLVSNFDFDAAKAKLSEAEEMKCQRSNRSYCLKAHGHLDAFARLGRDAKRQYLESWFANRFALKFVETTGDSCLSNYGSSDGAGDRVQGLAHGWRRRATGRVNVA